MQKISLKITCINTELAGQNQNYHFQHCAWWNFWKWGHFEETSFCYWPRQLYTFSNGYVHSLQTSAVCYFIVSNITEWLSIAMGKKLILHKWVFLGYFSGPNNGVVLNKCVGWIFSLSFIGECMFMENFQIFIGEKTHVGGIFFVNK